MKAPKNGLGRVGILAGGPSNEREISLRSGKAVHRALVGEGVDAVLLEVGSDIQDMIKRSRIDVVFIALHGRFGEDGTVQKILEDLDMPYTGSGVEASRLALDKIASKQVFEGAMIPVPRYVAFEKDRLDEREACALGFPMVVKPHLEGSSIGLSVVREKSALAPALKKAFEYGDRALVEEYIDGRELTVGIVDDVPLPVIEIVTKAKIYDYSAKYSDPETKYLVPAPISADESLKARELGLRAHKALGCRCFSRIDMMMDPRGALFVLEANTIPGMTERSLLPKAAGAKGLNFGALCITLVKDALQRRPVPSICKVRDLKEGAG